MPWADVLRKTNRYYDWGEWDKEMDDFYDKNGIQHRGIPKPGSPEFKGEILGIIGYPPVGWHMWEYQDTYEWYQAADELTKKYEELLRRFPLDERFETKEDAKEFHRPKSIWSKE